MEEPRCYSPQRKCLLLILLASLCGATGVGIATSGFGPGTSPDSATYLAGAANLLSGQGYTRNNPDGTLRPITHWPPFYSVLIASVTPLGHRPIAAAGIIAIVFFFLSIGLAGFMLRSGGGNVALVGLAAFAMALSYDLVRLHSMVLSETPFFTLMLGSLWLAARHLKSQNLAPLVLAAIAAALSMLTRYAGAAVIMAVGLVILFHNSTPIQRRLRNSVVFGLISCVPFVLLIGHNALLGPSATNRRLAFHPPDFSYVYSAATTVSEWLLPSTTPIALRAAALLLLVIAVVWLTAFLWRNRMVPEASQSRHCIAILLLVFIMSYILVYVLTVTFFDSYIVEKLSFRAMSPLLLAGLMLLMLSIQRAIDLRPAGTSFRYAVYVLLAGFIAVQSFQSLPWMFASRRDGIGLTSRKWQESDLITAVRKLPAGTPVITNGAEVIFLNTSRTCYRIPAKLDPTSLMANQDFAAEMSSLRQLIASRGAAVVYFNNFAFPSFMPSLDEIKSSLALTTAGTCPDGSIFARPD